MRRGEYDHPIQTKAVGVMREENKLRSCGDEVPGCPHKPRAHICLTCYRKIINSTNKYRSLIEKFSQDDNNIDVIVHPNDFRNWVKDLSKQALEQDGK